MEKTPGQGVMFSDIGKGTSKIVNEEDERHSGGGLLLWSLPSPYNEWADFLNSVRIELIASLFTMGIFSSQIRNLISILQTIKRGNV